MKKLPPCLTNDKFCEIIEYIRNYLKNKNLNFNNIELKDFTYEAILTSYSRGGGYSNEEIKSYAQILIQITNSKFVEEEIKRSNIQMEEQDIWFMTGEIMKSLNNEGKGYSKEEIIEMTVQYIKDERYKNFIGYNRRLLDVRLPMSGTTKS